MGLCNSTREAKMNSLAKAYEQFAKADEYGILHRVGTNIRIRYNNLREKAQAQQTMINGMYNIDQWALDTFGNKFTTGWYRSKDNQTPNYTNSYIDFNLEFPKELEIAYQFKFGETPYVDNELVRNWNKIDGLSVSFYKELTPIENIEGIQDFAFPETSSIITGDNMIEATEDLMTLANNGTSTAKDILIQIAERLTKATGVSYTLINTPDAESLLPGKYKGENAFFYNNKVYLVGDRFSRTTVFHEFSHPFVRLISLDNAPLFDKLYTDLVSSNPNLIMQVREAYPELEFESAEFKEEALVFAVSQAANEQYKADPTSPFMKFVKELLYHIKQNFRKLFGKKITISSLTPETTIEDLGKILAEGDLLELDLTKITNDEIVSFNRDLDNEFKAIMGDPMFNTVTNEINKSLDVMYSTLGKMKGISASEPNRIDALGREDSLMGLLSSNMYSESYIQKMVNLLRPNKRTEAELIRIRGIAKLNKDDQLLKEVNAALTPDANTGLYDLVKIKSLVYNQLSDEDKILVDSNLAQAEGILREFAQDLRNDLEFEAQRAKALTETVFLMANVSGKITDRLERLSQDVDNKLSLREAKLYADQLRYWNVEWKDIRDGLIGAGLSTASPIIGKLNEILTNVEKGLKITHEIAAKGSAETLATVLEPLQEGIDKYYTDILTRLREQNASPRRIKALEDEYKSVTLIKTDEKGNKISIQTMLENTFAGELGDANPFNSFFEGYMYNQDPTIMGFAKYVKDNFTDVLVTAQKKFNEFIYEMKPLLEAAGWNPNNVGGLGKEVTFEDLVGYMDEEGKYQTRLVASFLNPNKNYRADLYRMQNEIKIAEQAYNNQKTDENLKVLNDLQKAFDEWKDTYFYREYVDEVYEINKVFNQGPNDTIGEEAKKRLDIITNEIQQKSNPQSALQEEELRQAWIRRDRLFALTYEDGTAKTGKELQISERLQEYKKLSNKYYEWTLRPNAFQTSYINMYDATVEEVDRVLAQDPYNDPTTQAYQDKREKMINDSMNAWVEQNTEVKLTADFWQKRNELKAEMDDIASKVKQTDSYIEKTHKLFARRNAILLRTSDSNGQTDTTILTAKEIAELADIEDELRVLKENEFIRPGTGLNREQDRIYKEMQFNLARTKKELVKAERRLENTVNFKEAFQAEVDNLKAQITDYEKHIEGVKEAIGEAISPIEQNKYNTLKEEYDSMVTYLPSSHYFDDFIDAFSAIQDPDVKQTFLDSLGIQSIDEIRDMAADDQNTFLRVDNIELLTELDAGFNSWFKKAHKTYEWIQYGRDGGLRYAYNVRQVYTYMLPTDPVHYESTIVDIGKGPVTIPRTPSFKFKERKVKDFIIDDQGQRVELRTPKVMGRTVDNTGHWLPKNKEDMITYQRKNNLSDEETMKYINERYYALRDNNQAMFNVLEALVKNHLSNQDGATASARLYMDIPRFEKSFLETLQSRSTRENLKNNPISILIRKIREFFTKVKHAYLQDNNYEYEKDEFRLVSLDMMDDEISKLVIAGTNSIDVTNVSLDVMNSMMRYMLSVQRQKKLVEMLPVAKSLEQAFKDVEGKQIGIKDTTKVDRKNWYKQLLTQVENVKPKFLSNKSESTRSKMIKAIIDREFYGQMQAGFTKDSQALNKVSSLLMGRASFGYFAFNIPSAIKNNLGQQFQSMLYGVGGSEYNLKDLIFGETFGTKMSTMISFNVYNKAELPVMLQLIEIMDPVQGRTSDKFAKRLTRTFKTDLYTSGVLYNTRQWLQLQASLTVFGAHLNNKVLKQYNSDGSFQNIKYHEAWELVNGQIQLKSGINPEWSHEKIVYTFTPGDKFETVAIKYGLTTEELEAKITREDFDKLAEGNEVILGNSKFFKSFVNKEHDLQNKLNGAYAPWEQPEANRYLLFRLVSYLRKYFTRMFMHRFQYKGNIWRPQARYNIGAEGVELGWYIEAMRAIIHTIANKGRLMSTTTKQERFAMLRLMIELSSLVTLGFLLPLVLGFDPDDEEKYTKMRERSGHMPFIFAPEDPEYAFNLPGWLQNHAILMSMQVRQENEAFLPFPGFGSDDYINMASLKSIAFGPTIEAYTKMASSSIDALYGRESAQYKRDMGPYEWQREGGFKSIKYLAGMFGFTGSTLDPNTSLRTMMSMRARGK